MEKPYYEARVVEDSYQNFKGIIRGNHRDISTLGTQPGCLVEPEVLPRVTDEQITGLVKKTVIALAQDLGDKYDISIIIQKR